MIKILKTITILISLFSCNSNSSLFYNNILHGYEINKKTFPKQERLIYEKKLNTSYYEITSSYINATMPSGGLVHSLEIEILDTTDKNIFIIPFDSSECKIRFNEIPMNLLMDFDKVSIDSISGLIRRDITQHNKLYLNLVVLGKNKTYTYLGNRKFTKQPSDL